MTADERAFVRDSEVARAWGALEKADAITWETGLDGTRYRVEAMTQNGTAPLPDDWRSRLQAHSERTSDGVDVDFSGIVSILLGVEADHVFADTTTCRCGYKPADQKDWRYHVAGNQAEAVLTALGV